MPGTTEAAILRATDAISQSGEGELTQINDEETAVRNNV
jgi:hypothetical protein